MLIHPELAYYNIIYSRRHLAPGITIPAVAEGNVGKSQGNYLKKEKKCVRKVYKIGINMGYFF